MDLLDSKSAEVVGGAREFGMLKHVFRSLLKQMSDFSEILNLLSSDAPVAHFLFWLSVTSS